MPEELTEDTSEDPEDFQPEDLAGAMTPEQRKKFVKFLVSGGAEGGDVDPTSLGDV